MIRSLSLLKIGIDMKKHLFFLGLIASVSFSHAESWAPLPVTTVSEQGYSNKVYTASPQWSLSAEYSSYEADLDSGDTTKLDGVALGITTSPFQHGSWGKLEFLQDSKLDADYYEMSGGGHLNLVNAEAFYLIGSLGVGYAVVDSSLLSNTVQFVSIPVGVEAGYSIVPNLSVFAGVGYKWLFDVTSNTTCEDGTTSNSTGSGSCSWHDGISQYNDKVGDNNGATYKAGLRFNF